MDKRFVLLATAHAAVAKHALQYPHGGAMWHDDPVMCRCVFAEVTLPGRRSVQRLLAQDTPHGLDGVTHLADSLTGGALGMVRQTIE